MQLQRSIRALVVTGAAAAAVTVGAVAPASAASAGATAYNNVSLVKVWGGIGGKDACMSMAESKASNAALKLAKCNGTATQKWTLKGSNGVYTVKNKKSAKCLAVNKKTNGTVVIQRPCKASDKRQQWALSGSKIISRYASKAITVPKDKAGVKLVVGSGVRSQQEWGTR